MKKRCTKCGETKPLTAFSKDARLENGLRAACRVCVAEYSHQWHVANRERVNPRTRTTSRLNTAWLRLWVVTILGDGCAKCGTTGDLQIDHIHENGKEHRFACGMKPRSRGERGNFTQRTRYYRSMLESGCGGLQLLCRVCNTAKSNKHRATMRMKKGGK